jgi:hypothetical protein
MSEDGLVRDPRETKNVLVPEPSAILDSLHVECESRRNEEDALRQYDEAQARRLAEHAAYRERLAGAFNDAYAFPREETEQGRKPCKEGFRRWAERFVSLGTIMCRCDEAIERLNLRKRLHAVAQKPAPTAMKYACALVLLAAEGNSDAIAPALEKANRDLELQRFVLWLPFILDSLWLPYTVRGAAARVASSPDGTTFEEHLQAEQAFGALPITLTQRNYLIASTPANGMVDEARSEMTTHVGVEDTATKEPGRTRSDIGKDTVRTAEEIVSEYSQRHQNARMPDVVRETSLTESKVRRTDAWKNHENRLLDVYLQAHPDAETPDIKEEFGFSAPKIVGMAAWRQHMDRRLQRKPPPKLKERPLSATTAASCPDKTAHDPTEVVDQRDHLFQCILENADFETRAALNRLPSTARNELVEHVLGRMDGSPVAEDGSERERVIAIMIEVSESWLADREQDERERSWKEDS